MDLMAGNLNIMRVMLHVNQAQAIHDAALLLYLRRRRRRMQQRRRRRANWLRPWLSRRQEYGWYDTLLVELEMEDPPTFKNFMRMEPAMFHELAGRLTPRIEKRDTNYRKCIPPGMRLAITLRHLATGDTYRSLSFGFRVAHNTIAQIVPDVCQAIAEEYTAEVCHLPTSEEEWRRVAHGFSTRWNFQHCLGALDGKHVGVRCPINAGSLYFNYKSYHSIVLMAIVDADYKFLWVDIGANGAASDAQVFNSGVVRQFLEDERLHLPPPDPLAADDRVTPYFLVGDDAFALKTWMMKPFSRRTMNYDERIFNYRLSRARRVVENAFGILANRFACLHRRLYQQPAIVEKMVMACVCLHNLMRMRYPQMQNQDLDHEDEQHNLIPGAWREGRIMLDIERVRGGNRATRAAITQRLYLKHYYSSPAGSVPWQDRMI
jgi:hypothetical protein